MPKVTGKTELNSFLRDLPAKLERTILRGAMKAAGEVIAAEAKATVRMPREADRKIDVVVRTPRAEPGLVAVRVEVAGPGAFLARFQEYGTAAHYIRVSDEDRKGRTLKRINKLDREGTLAIGGKFVGPVVYHPGAKKIAFMRPALDRKQSDAIAAAAAYIGARLTKAGVSGLAPGGGDNE